MKNPFEGNPPMLYPTRGMSGTRKGLVMMVVLMIAISGVWVFIGPVKAQTMEEMKEFAMSVQPYKLIPTKYLGSVETANGQVDFYSIVLQRREHILSVGSKGETLTRFVY